MTIVADGDRDLVSRSNGLGGLSKHWARRLERYHCGNANDLLSSKISSHLLRPKARRLAPAKEPPKLMLANRRPIRFPAAAVPRLRCRGGLQGAISFYDQVWFPPNDIAFRSTARTFRPFRPFRPAKTDKIQNTTSSQN
jgi:hypothetical protein